MATAEVIGKRWLKFSAGTQFLPSTAGVHWEGASIEGRLIQLFMQREDSHGAMGCDCRRATLCNGFLNCVPFMRHAAAQTRGSRLSTQRALVWGFGLSRQQQFLCSG